MKRVAAAWLMMGLFGLLPATACACPAATLGTSRTLDIGTEGGLQVGLKTYPQTLQLADHEVILTFDDGPNPGTTDRILDALAEQCVKATFFIIGRHAEEFPQLVKRAFAEGHTIGHHTYSHPERTLRFMSEAAAKADIDRGFAADDLALYGKAEAEPKIPFFRFPGFADTPALDAWLSLRNIAIFGADAWASDWEPQTPDEELDRLMRRLRQSKGGIVLLHDTKRSTALILPSLLEILKLEGFKIVHMVPGKTKPVLTPISESWSSETDTIISQRFAALKPKQKRKHLHSATLPAPRGKHKKARDHHLNHR